MLVLVGLRPVNDVFTTTSVSQPTAVDSSVLMSTLNSGETVASRVYEQRIVNVPGATDRPLPIAWSAWIKSIHSSFNNNII